MIPPEFPGIATVEAYMLGEMSHKESNEMIFRKYKNSRLIDKETQVEQTDFSGSEPIGID